MNVEKAFFLQCCELSVGTKNLSIYASFVQVQPLFYFFLHHLEIVILDMHSYFYLLIVHHSLKLSVVGVQKRTSWKKLVA